jgi:hypothetical protein
LPPPPPEQKHNPNYWKNQTRRKFKQDRKRQTKDYGYCGTTTKRPPSHPQKQDFAPYQHRLNLCFLEAGMVVVVAAVAVRHSRMEARKEEEVMQGYRYLGRKNLMILMIVGATLSKTRRRIGWSRQKRRPSMWTSTWSRTVVDIVGAPAASSHKSHKGELLVETYIVFLLHWNLSIKMFRNEES